jgi:hypothetical protein
MGGQIVDATVVEARRPRLNRAAANALGVLSTVGLRNLLRPAIIREAVDT